MKPILWIVAGGVALFGAALFVSGIRVGDDGTRLLRDRDPDVIALGSTVYEANCASCHGANLEGQPNWRAPDADGRLPAPPHDETGHTWHHDGDTLFRLVKYGTGALIGDPDYATNMPIYEGVLSDDEIVAVLSYIKSTWPDEIRAGHNDMETN